MPQSVEPQNSARPARQAFGERPALSLDGELSKRCLAARAAARAFDDAARRGEPFGALCDLSIEEQRAVKAVSDMKSSTPKGIAEKALLLDYYFHAVGRREVSEETFDVAVSLAADAVALAKALIRGAPTPRNLSPD